MKITIQTLRWSVLLVFLALLTAGCNTKPAHTETAAPAAVAVDTLVLAAGDWPDEYVSSGTVHARTAAQISSRMMAYVREVGVRPGDRVRAGQVLLRLDGQDIQARARQAEAGHREAQSVALVADQGIASAKSSMDLADATYRRMKDLHDKRSLSHQEFDEASARLGTARAALQMAEANRKQAGSRIQQAEEESKGAAIQSGYSTLAAPFSGVITARIAEPGSLAVPGMPLLTLEQEGGYRFEAEVPERYVTKIRAGQQVVVQLDSASQALEGRIGEIVPAVDPLSRSFTVKIDLPSSPQLRSGLFGRVRFPIGSRRTLAIPQSAIVERGQMQWVFVVDGQLARARIVTTGERSGEHTGDQNEQTAEVLSGLAAGERIIAPAPRGLVDGAPVQVRSAERRQDRP